MKRYIHALLILLLSITLLCACGGETAEAPGGETTQPTQDTTETTVQETTGCTHNYSDWVIAQEATCAKEGLKVRKCHLCFIEETEAIPTPDHLYSDWFVKVEQVGCSDGENFRMCKNCGKEESQIIPGTGHDFTPWAVEKEAYLCVDGYEARKCNKCGKEETKVLPASMTHVEVIDPAVAATCTTPGRTQGSHCSVCTSTIVAFTEIPALPHTEVIDKGYAATCTVNGKTDGKHCSVCNTVLVPQSTIAAKHKEVTTKGYAATCTADGLTDGKSCSVCNTVLSKQTIIPKLGHKNQYQFTKTDHSLVCTVCGERSSASHTFKSGATACSICPYFKELPPDFPTGFVTTETTYIETEYALFEIDPKIYVRSDLAEMTNELCKAMEKVTGLSFNTEQNKGAKVLIKVVRYDDPSGDNETAGRGTATPSGYFLSSREDKCWNIINIGPWNLFLGKNSTLLHELGHVLRYRQSVYVYNDVLEEGFASYVQLKTLKYLEQTNSPLAYSLDPSSSALTDIQNFKCNLYDQAMEHWLVQSHDYYFYEAGNDAYAYGMRFMTYLEQTYNDYMAWFSVENIDGAEAYLRLPAGTDIEILKRHYGTDCLDHFYPWLKQRDSEFKVNEARDLIKGTSATVYDMTGIPPISPYPSFVGQGTNEFSLCDWSFRYQDLYINISEAVNYLKNYKQRNVDDLRLCLSDTATVQLFNAEGCLIAQTTDKVIPLKGVAYIKLVGKGFMGTMDIVGYYKESIQFNTETVLHTAVPDDHSDKSSTAWTYINIVNDRILDYELLFREDITVVARLTAPCQVEIVDLGWNHQIVTDKTEIILSNTRFFRVTNLSTVPITLEIVVVPKA